MNKSQEEAIRQLEKALLRMKRNGLAMVGSDDCLIVVVEDEEFQQAAMEDSSCEAARSMRRDCHPNSASVKTYGVYLDSGGA